jgi:hypothetical protein
MYENLLANVPTDLWIGGKCRKSSDNSRFDIIDPATENVITTVASATVDDAKAAIDAASEAFPGWAARKPRERGEILRKAYELIMAQAERIARLITLENGKALPDSRGEVAYAAEFFRWYAEEAVRNIGQVSTAPASGARILVHHNALRRGLGQPELSKDKLMGELTEVAPRILPYVDVTWDLLDRERRAGKRILFEGAQGALLDVDHGTYPFVTSSNTVAAQAAIGSGMGPGAIGHVLGIAKAYTTRVGAGPFPTELTDAIGEKLGERGHEFGVVTGRKRRCGWFDACLVRQTIKVAGIDGIALTKLDVLDGFDRLEVCVGYHLDGERIDRLPAGHNAQARLQPIYQGFEGWSQSTQGARSWSELPAQAVKYVRAIEELIECPVTLLSTSPERDDTILMRDPFRD